MPDTSKKLDFNFNLNTSLGVVIFLLIVVVGVYLNKEKLGIGNTTSIPVASAGPSKYDDFAKCLTEKGAKLYGAFWCGHCQALKAALGSSFQYINYIECTENGARDSFSQACRDAGIKGYPTWKFSDGSAMTEKLELMFGKLSEKTGCALPQ